MRSRHAFVAAALAMAATTCLAQPAAQRGDFCSLPPYQSTINEGLAKWRPALKEKRFADLEHFFGGLQKRYEAGEVDDLELSSWFWLFSKSDPALTPLHRDWIKGFPASHAARIALAHHFIAIAGDSRGGEYAEKTSESQFELMKSFHEQALAELSEAEKLTPRPIVAAQLRSQLARHYGRALSKQSFDRAQAIDSSNLVGKSLYAIVLQPKWGGSLKELRDFQSTLPELTRAMKPAQKRWLEGRLASLVGDALQDASQVDEAEAAYLAAAKACPARTAPLVAMIAMDTRLKRYSGVAVATTRYLEAEPASGWAYAKRGHAHYQLGDLDKSLADYGRSAELGDAHGANGLAWFHEKGRGVAKDLKRAADLYRLAAAGKVEGAAKSLARVQAEAGAK